MGIPPNARTHHFEIREVHCRVGLTWCDRVDRDHVLGSLGRLDVGLCHPFTMLHRWFLMFGTDADLNITTAFETLFD